MTGFFLIARIRRSWALAWLTLASLFFYGWWRVEYVPLLVGSVLFNYAAGQRLYATRSALLYWLAIATNLALLGIFKYADFAAEVARDLSGRPFTAPHLLLPLAISFFTFQQIAYLTDLRAGLAPPPGLLKYALFVTFFPHLIAGPITHSREMIPQFAEDRIFRLHSESFAAGLTLIVIGLFKKCVLADGAALYASPVFAGAASGADPGFIESWAGALAYAFQLYFDFSGYSDMAIGLGLLVGIRLPRNFNSPYRATSIIEFWSRWHMTLTRFLTAYLYNPLVMSLTRRRMQQGRPVLDRGVPGLATFAVLVAGPTLVTFFLSGLWHGAGYQFLVWGCLHGVFVTVNQFWRRYKKLLPLPSAGRLGDVASWGLTFTSVVVAAVFFRAPDLATAWKLVGAMAGTQGVVLPNWYEYPAALAAVLEAIGVRFDNLPLFWGRGELFNLALLFVISLALPNTERWLRLFATALGPALRPSALEQLRGFRGRLAPWVPTPAFGFVVGVIGFAAFLKTFSQAPSEFLYFAF